MKAFIRRRIRKIVYVILLMVYLLCVAFVEPSLVGLAVVVVLLSAWGVRQFQTRLSSYKRAQAILPDLTRIRVTGVPASQASANRIQHPERLTANILWSGGEGLFTELGFPNGFLAVEYSPSGRVVHAWPYRFDGFDEWQKLVELPRETNFPYLGHHRLLNMPTSVRKYDNGDLMVMFRYSNTVPYEGGVARIDRSGNPVWVRCDYSNHWPTLYTDEDGEELAVLHGMTAQYNDQGQCVMTDHVRVLDGGGSVVRDFQVIDSLSVSPYASMVEHSPSKDHLLHLNYIDRVRDDVRDLPGVCPGDYVVSLRNISAFGILDKETGNFKRMIRGTFTKQHSVQHLSGSVFLLFDNLGAEHGGIGPSRILLVDIAHDAVRERTVYPRLDTPFDHRFFSKTRGNISISADRERIIVVSTNEGLGYEIEIATGLVLNVFRNQHDLTGQGLGRATDWHRAVSLALWDLTYV